MGASYRSVGLSAWPPSSFFPSISLPLDTGGGVGPPTPIGVGGPLVGFIVCHPLEQIELQAKLLNYFLGSNKSNINQTPEGGHD